MSVEALFEVMPAQGVREKTLQQFYADAYQRDSLEIDGYIPVDPTASRGIAIKIVRELLV